MIETETYSPVQIFQYDPSRTTTLRNRFVREMRRRFAALIRVIRTSVVDEDCFGLEKLQAQQLGSAGHDMFDFPRTQAKVEGFMQWLRRQVDKGLLETVEIPQMGMAVEQPWTNIYILDSYRRGVMRGRSELRKAGYAAPTIEQSGGLDAVMSGPFHIDRVGLMYTRAFGELRGITTAMDSQISRVLSQGLIDGDNPRLLARKLVATINGAGIGDLALTDTLGRFIPALRRAETLARTEVIRAHHMATVQEYKNWEAEGVTVIAEWATAGDDRVCDECANMHGNRYSLREIEHMIPRHPNCRCVALPVTKETK